MIVFYIILITAGFSYDVIDFVIRCVKALKRERVPSAGMFVGFVLQSIGLIGLTRRSVISWKYFFIFLGLAFLLHLFIHIILPLPFTMACNIYYGRKLFDMSTLPIKGASKTKK